MAESLGFKTLPLGNNYGFGGAIMRALARMDADFVLVCNPDVVVGTESVKALLAAAQRYSDTDIFVPALLRVDGRPFFRFETKVKPASGIKVDAGRILPAGDACVRLISGAVFLVRRKEFLSFGFDPHIFLYFEDDDLALSYWAAKRAIVYVPEAQFLHVGNGSSSPSPALDILKGQSFGWSLGYTMTKHKTGDIRTVLRSARLKYWGALLSGRRGRARYHQALIEGVKRFLRGERAPYLPEQ